MSEYKELYDRINPMKLSASELSEKVMALSEKNKKTASLRNKAVIGTGIAAAACLSAVFIFGNPDKGIDTDKIIADDPPAMTTTVITEAPVTSGKEHLNEKDDTEVGGAGILSEILEVKTNSETFENLDFEVVDMYVDGNNTVVLTYDAIGVNGCDVNEYSEKYRFGYIIYEDTFVNGDYFNIESLLESVGTSKYEKIDDNRIRTELIMHCYDYNFEDGYVKVYAKDYNEEENVWDFEVRITGSNKTSSHDFNRTVKTSEVEYTLENIVISPKCIGITCEFKSDEEANIFMEQGVGNYSDYAVYYRGGKCVLFDGYTEWKTANEGYGYKFMFFFNESIDTENINGIMFDSNFYAIT